jgi:NADPH2:quinone reductase
MQNTMKAVRQAEAGGRLLIETVPLPEPGPGQVLVRMAASPINPSDLASIREPYMVSSWPFTPGLEGSGTVVRAGKGLLPALRKGKRVACSPDPGGDGTWAEYLLTSALRTVPLPAKVGFDQGSMLLVNPMTAMAFIHMARRGRHGAMVNNAGASSLGRMLIRLTTHYGIPLISIVRREDQVEALKTEGAVHVLNSSDPSFEADLRDVSGRLGATLVLDAVTGPETGRLLRNVPDGATLVAYARLSGASIQADPSDLIRHGRTITGFQLGLWLNSKPPLFKLRLSAQVRKMMQEFLYAKIHRTFPLEEVEAAVQLYRENMSGGKILLIPG